MRKLLKGVGVLVLLVGLWLGLVLSEWLPPQTDAQREALALMEAVPANVAGERNAFAAMWLFGYAVPEAELEQVAAADAAAFLEAAQRTGNVTDFRSSADGKYPAIAAPPNGDPVLCEPWGSACLARVRADPAKSRARLQEFAPRLAQADRLNGYDYYRYGFLPRFDSPIGGGTGISLQATAAALDFIDGKPDAAFARLCRDTATWRRLRSQADTLIIDMIGVAQMSGATRLYAEMLAEQPADFVAPCPETFAALTDTEANQCAAIRGEYQFTRNSVIDAVRTNAFAARPRPRWYTESLARLINERHILDLTASTFAPMCGEANRERVRRRDPSPLAVDVACGSLGWSFDPVGCGVFTESAPAYNDYYQRVLDLDARLKLLQSAIWLRAQPADGDRGAQFAARPLALQSASHAMQLDAQSGQLRMTNLQKSKGEVWEIPYAMVPASAIAPAPAAAAPDKDGG